MSTVRTRAEALAAVSAALGVFERRSLDAIDDFLRETNRLAGVVAGEVARRRHMVAQVETALRGADEEARPRLEVRLAEALRALDEAVRAAAVVDEEAAHVSAERRRFGDRTHEIAVRAEANLRRMTAAVHSYAHSAKSRADGPGPSPATVSPPDGLHRALSDRGLEPLDVMTVDHSGDPITSWTKGPPSDFLWAVDRWDTVVAPAVARGATRETFAQLDADAGAPDRRRLAAVYDLFLGSDPIDVCVDAAGRTSVNSGRHRLDAARTLGVRTLPARVRRVP
jgi:uncharacterized ParB-like nuclease family protein